MTKVFLVAILALIAKNPLMETVKSGAHQGTNITFLATNNKLGMVFELEVVWLHQSISNQ